MKKLTTISILLGPLMSVPAVAYDYVLGSDFKIVNDSNYRVFCNSSGECYLCSDEIYPNVARERIIVYDDETVRWNNHTYLCVEDTGYWLDLGNTSTVPPRGTCPNETEWESLGNHKYCQATLEGTWNRWAPDCGSGIQPYTSCPGACEYYGWCSTFSHCDTGYYKNGNKCTQCPSGGTTSGYTNGGIADCFLPVGTTGTDTSGAWTILNNICKYVI